MDLLYIPIGITLLILLCGMVFLAVKWRRADRKHKELERRFSDVSGRMGTLQLQSLESRLDPHLLKNILNSIQAHAYQTYFSLDKLANVLDYILYESRHQLVSPKDEIAFALNLIEINKIKVSPLFELQVKQRIDEQDARYRKEIMAPLISVDLIENAFKHADLQSPDAFISIVFEFRDAQFSLSVTNKISERSPIAKSHSGIGMETLENRLQILYPKRFTLENFIEKDVYIARLKINLRDHHD